MTWQKWAWTATLLGLFALAGCGDGQPPGHARDDGGAETPPDGGKDYNADDAGSAPDADTQGDAGARSDAQVDPGDDASVPALAHWFEDRTPLELSISGPLSAAFRAAFAGTPDGIVPPDRKKDPFDAQLSVSGAAQADVVLSVRGNSSLQECEFPKLKLAFAERVSDASDTFFATKKIKIGTHCGEEEATNGTIGRLRHERAAFREEVVYQLARALGITIMQTRPAIIDYTDTTLEEPFASPLKRKAFLLEHIDELARRLGAEALQDPVSCGDDPSLKPDPKAVLRVKLFHAMIGNWDFALGPPETQGCGSLQNTEVIVHPEGYLTLVPADFDLAAFVVGEVRDPESNQLEPISEENAVVSARTYLASAVAGEPKQAVDALEAEYVAKKAELASLVQASVMDDDGKRTALLLLDGFFIALAE
jgi:hypothetical protein